MQPVSGFQYTLVTGGVGTALIKTGPTYLKRMFIPGTFVGTINLQDAPSVTGTTATGTILSLGIPTPNTFVSFDLDIQCKTGLVYQATGTPVVTLVWN